MIVTSNPGSAPHYVNLFKLLNLFKPYCVQYKMVIIICTSWIQKILSALLHTVLGTGGTAEIERQKFLSFGSNNVVRREKIKINEIKMAKCLGKK